MKHDEHLKKTKKEELNSWLIVGLGVVLLVVVVFSIIQTGSVKASFNEKLTEAKEAARPAKIELQVISDSSCSDCFDITPIVESVKGTNVEVTKTSELNAQEAKGLITKYSIDRLPALIVTGELNKTNLKDFVEKDDALVYVAAVPPFTDPVTMQVKGKVTTKILLAKDCELCIDLGQVVAGLKQSGIIVDSENKIDSDSEEGKKLISKYSIELLPTLIVSDDILAYGEGLEAQLAQAGFSKVDNDYVLKPISAPFVNLSTGEIEGLISVVYLTDSTCTECYDAQAVHKEILQRLSPGINNEKFIDIGTDEGKALIEKYKITKVPTILMMGEMNKYPALVGAWAQVGTVESDGAYVFREMSLIKQIYKDLETNKVVDPNQVQE